VTIDNAMERFRTRQRSDAVDRLEAVFGTLEDEEAAEAEEMEGRILSLPGAGSSRREAAERHEEPMAPSLRAAVEAARRLIAKAEAVLPGANPEDASELRALLTDLRSAIDRRAEEAIQATSREIEDIVFYLEDA
jgi:molecular chaperone DnaK